MKPVFALLPLAAATIAAVPAEAQSFQYDSRWYAGVRENVLLLQERHRVRIEQMEARRARRTEGPNAIVNAGPGGGIAAPRVAAAKTTG